jgi:hypothetical protein
MRILFLILLFGCTFLQANDLAIVNRPYRDDDHRNAYAYELLLQALQKTIPQYGQYELRMANLGLPRGNVTSPPAIASTNDRLLYEIKRGEIVNVAIAVSRPEWEKEVLPIRIPVDMGLMSYRIFLIRADDQARFSALENIEQLKALRSGVGETWFNYRVLQHHGFTIVPTSNYEGQFRMLLAGRFDYITRSPLEAFTEIDLFGKQFPQLAIEQNLLLYIPLPTYFFVSPSQPQLAHRIEAGLRLMLRDGSYQKIIRRHLGAIMEQTHFCERRVFRLDNPFLSRETPAGPNAPWFDPWRGNAGAKPLCAPAKSAPPQSGQRPS